jgi:hypothetical protein
MSPADAAPDPESPSGRLLEVSALVIAPWIERRLLAALGERGTGMEAEVAARARETSDLALGQLRILLMTDVDEQRTTPLEGLRGCTAIATAFLRSLGVPAPRREVFEAERFPDDPYGLGPVTWRDVDDALVEVGIVWGAWKASTVLGRRRAEGRR